MPVIICTGKRCIGINIEGAMCVVDPSHAHEGKITSCFIERKVCGKKRPSTCSSALKQGVTIVNMIK